jgi:hypothetical protein
VQFKTADFLYRRAEMSAANIDDLLDIWAESMVDGEEPPFTSHADVYETIDATRHGDAPWRCIAVSYDGETNHQETCQRLTRDKPRLNVR